MAGVTSSYLSVLSVDVSVIVEHKYLLSAAVQADGVFAFYHIIGGVNASTINGTSGIKKSIIVISQ